MLVLIYRPRKDGRLSWPWTAFKMQHIATDTSVSNDDDYYYYYYYYCSCCCCCCYSSSSSSCCCCCNRQSDCRRWYFIPVLVHTCSVALFLLHSVLFHARHYNQYFNRTLQLIIFISQSRFRLA